MPATRLNYLLQQYAAKTCTDEEKQELSEMILGYEQEEMINNFLQDTWNDTVAEQDMPEEKTAYIIDYILQQKTNEEIQAAKKIAPIIKIINWRKIAAAVAILVLFAGGSYLIFNKKNAGKENIATVKDIKKDIAAPKVTKATITLSNGQTVLLDSMNHGLLATQGNVNVTKTADGQIIYTGSGSSPKGDAEVSYNTLTNPRGSTVINLTLSDGTKVWLNSESSFKYPIAFAGNERKVEISGEAYFEVSKDTHKKFLVDAKGVITEVLGTHFNVNSYADEASIKITLLEGSVKVTKGTIAGLLKPGQQALVDATNNININEVNEEGETAWKDGYFHFTNADISQVMRQMARWYDVEVAYEGNIPKRAFSGDIDRNSKASVALKILALSKVHFRIEGRKIIVTN